MLNGIQLNIVQPEALPADPFVGFLKYQTGADCHLLNDQQCLDNDIPKHNTPSLTLVDAQNSDNYQPLNVYQVSRKQSQEADLFAFFNVDAGSEIEKMAGELDIQGLFYAGIEPENIGRGINAILNGELWLPRKVLFEQLRKTRSAQSNTPDYNQTHDVLTNREIEILSLIATGAKNSDIAQNLCLSVHTIKTHIYHIYKKINVSNRMQAVNWASQNL